MKDKANDSIKIGTYELDSFEFNESKLFWKVVISNVHLSPEQVDVDEVAVDFRYQPGRRVTVDKVVPSKISGKVPVDDPDSFGKGIQRRIAQLIQAILDSSEDSS